MGSWWFPRRAAEPQDRSAAAGGQQAKGKVRPPRSPYSLQYETIVAQGHERPTPSFGAPALIWHVGIWPRRTVDGEGGEPQPCDPHDTAGEKHAKAKNDFEQRRKHWVAQIRRLLDTLQESGCHPDGGPPRRGAKELKLVRPHDLEWRPRPDDPDNFFEPVDILEQGAAPFTLWWPDASETDPAAARANAIRICVHPEVNADYACFSFYMDIGQRWNEAHDATAKDALGARRRSLLSAVENIGTMCELQLEPVPPGAAAIVDFPAVPESLRCPDGCTPQQLDNALRDARNLLYVDIWEAFSDEMGCRLEDIAGTRGEVFANFRGLVMSTNGLGDDRPVYQPKGHETASAGTATFANFSRDESFDADGAEANAVVKAFWPFVRRVTPRADYREFIACGVLDWRAIYITALGSSSQYVERQEREPSATEGGEASIRVPEPLLAVEEKPLAAASEAGRFDSLVRERKGRSGNNHPVRYLLLTKYEPHPRQIGRIAERINAMGTMRLFALKDWAAVRNADPYIRILGQELDQITKNWGRDRKLINGLTSLEVVHLAKEEIERLGVVATDSDEQKQRKLAAFVPRQEKPKWSGIELLRLMKGMPTYTPSRPAPWVIRILLRLRFFYNWRRYGELLKSMENDLVADIRHSALYEISNEVETDLIDISSKLDELGFGAIGGLHFRLNRSAYHVREFYILLKTLQVQNIPTWVSYEQFVRRGLAPAFDYMASVGKRLRAVRTRLLTTTETIETSALVGQSAATRHNTAVLRHTTTLAILILLIFLASTNQAIWLANRIWQFVFNWLPASVTSQIDEIVSPIQSFFQ
jgi:hypothetical protein